MGLRPESPMACVATSRATYGAAWVGPTRRRTGCAATAPEGDLLGKIHIPETVANLTFGGLQRNRLYICGSTSLYACYVDTQGAMQP